MRRLLLLIAFLLAPLSAPAQIATGEDTTPTINDIVLDTGPMVSGRLTWFQVNCVCSVGPEAAAKTCGVMIEHRDAANTANVADGLVGTHGVTMLIAQGEDSDEAFSGPVMGSEYWPKSPDWNWNITIAENERIRVRLLSTFTGQIYCNMLYR
jgi:hypothetical protein